MPPPGDRAHHLHPTFRGAGLIFVPVALLQAGLTAAFTLALLLALAALEPRLGAELPRAVRDGIGPFLDVLGLVRIWLEERGPVLLSLPEPRWAGLAAALLVLRWLVGMPLRHHRITHTTMLGSQLRRRRDPVGSLWLNLSNFLVLVASAGFALPWVIVRSRRFHYRRCVFRDRPEVALAFSGRPPQAGTLLLHTFLLLPAVLLSGFLLVPVIAWIWTHWEESHVRAPDREGVPRECRLVARPLSYLGLCYRHALFLVLSGGLYGPWATLARWRWVAAHLEFRALPRARP